MKLSDKSKILIVISIAAALVFEAVFLLGEEIQGEQTSFVPRIFSNKANLLEAIGKDFTVKTEDNGFTFVLKPESMESWLTYSFMPYLGRREKILDQERVRQFLIELGPGLAEQPINARVAANDDGKLFELKESKAGRMLDIEASKKNITNALNNGKSSANLVFESIQPQISLAGIQAEGIDSLLGIGHSNFSGSPKARTTNISVGSTIINGTIVNRGEEFSFNKKIGPVDASTGFKPELVIKNKSLIAEYGGGLCQVSTTVFRAAMEAGLKIVERHPHSLPVRYYSPQGYDATVYPEISDFRFQNDTPAAIFIQSRLEDGDLYFEIYGKKDGRKVSIDGPHIYETGDGGAMKTWLKRTVTFADMTTHEDMFYSNYKSPSLFPTVRNPLE